MIKIGLSRRSPYINHFEALNREAQMHCDIEVFRFSPKDVDIERKTITGLFYDKQSGCYTQRQTEYPDIIDSHPFAFRKNRPEKSDLRKNCLFMAFNPKSKQWTYSILNKNGFSRYAIDSYNYNDIDIIGMLDKHKELIIKPRDGIGGAGVHKISPLENAKLLVRLKHEQWQVSSEEFKNQYHPRFCQEDFIVQPYCNFTTTSVGAPFDIRMHMARGKEGEWLEIAKFPRIGSVHGITSNLTGGGYSMGYGFERWLLAEYGEDAQRINDELKYIGKTLPDLIRQSIGETKLVADMGFDIGIDRNNNNQLKILEINTINSVVLESSAVAFYKARVEYYRYLYKNFEQRLKKQIVFDESVQLKRKR